MASQAIKLYTLYVQRYDLSLFVKRQMHIAMCDDQEVYFARLQSMTPINIPQEKHLESM